MIEFFQVVAHRRQHQKLDSIMAAGAFFGLMSTQSYSSGSFVMNITLFISLLIVDIFQVLRSSPQLSTVQRQGAVTMENKLTTTAGLCQSVFVSFLFLFSVFLEPIPFPSSGSVSTLFWVSLKWRHTSTDISTSRHKIGENADTPKKKTIKINQDETNIYSWVS